jgi:hypothetical protein
VDWKVKFKGGIMVYLIVLYMSSSGETEVNLD